MVCSWSSACQSTRRPLRASTARHRNAQTTGPSTHTGSRRTPAHTPRSRPRPSPAPDPPAAPPGQRPAGAAPTEARGTPPYRRTPRRSPRPRQPASTPAATAAPATSPDPASPQSTPARKTRTAAPRVHASPHGPKGGPPTTPAHPRPRRRSRHETGRNSQKNITRGKRTTRHAGRHRAAGYPRGRKPGRSARWRGSLSVGRSWKRPSPRPRDLHASTLVWRHLALGERLGYRDRSQQTALASPPDQIEGPGGDVRSRISCQDGPGRQRYRVGVGAR